ncbi:TPX2 [Macleaya cordata]|uniref:TPX2 n=1 Tax=Macleaya cordata TaxID=56857 RepID=A0A200Q4B7_MACCD|nr:TPX2 [Macleaya cordata]
MDQDPYCLIDYPNGNAHDPINENRDLIEMDVHIKEDLASHIVEENMELKDYEVKECTMENLVKIPDPNQVDICHKEEQDVVPSKSKNIETDFSGEKTRELEEQKLGNHKKVISTVKPASKSAATRSVRSNHTVPQPFALATEKRASSGARPVGAETAAAVSTNKASNVSDLHNSNTLKKSQLKLPLVSRKPLQPDNSKHPDEDDACSVASSTAASVQTVKSRNIIASAPVFRCTDRAEKRKEFYSKLEEKHQALEAERTQCEARTKEEREAALKQLRRSLMFKANPMPSFYHEGPPPKVELKKLPPTRAKSPKLGRRKSCSDAINSSQGDNERVACGRVTRQSLGTFKEDTTNSPNNNDGNENPRSKGERKPIRGTPKSAPAKITGQRNVDITVQS